MQKDYRPYTIKRFFRRFQKYYTNHFLRPNFTSLGKGHMFMRPWHVKLFGSPISIGDYATVIAAPDGQVHLSVWPEEKNRGKIEIGNYCLICPGVRVSSAAAITIADNCMLANGVYVTDSDWHDIYNRTTMGKNSPIHIDENAWIGDSAIVCKGVTIGKNSIVGAGAVVVNDVPANTIAAGNPAKIVKALDPKETITTRNHLYANPKRLSREFEMIDRERLKGNTITGWLRNLIFPGK